VPLDALFQCATKGEETRAGSTDYRVQVTGPSPTPSVQCGNCGLPLDEPTNLDPANRQPCPRCGSHVRSIQVSATDKVSITDTVDAKIGTSLVAPLLAAAGKARDEALAADWTDALGPAVVAILCAATALEAATNWAAEAEPTWLDEPLPGKPDRTNAWLPPDQKWTAWILHRTGDIMVRDKGLGQRVIALVDDRNLIAHFREVRGRDGKVKMFHPPSKLKNISEVRAYFTGKLVAAHVATATEAIDRLK
jgi:hypothetical protein